MRKFTKLVAPALVAVLGLSAIAPAIAEASPAQHTSRHETARPGNSNNTSLRNDIQGLRGQIDRAVNRRTITQRQAVELRRDATQIQRLYSQYARNGLTRNETRTLENRVNKVQASLRHDQRRDAHHRR